MPMPAVSAVLSFSPKVWMANSFSHSGVNWMKVWPSEFSGDAGVVKMPIHSPKAASSSAIPIARPIATTPTSPAAATLGRQGCGPCGWLVSALVSGRSLVVMPWIRACSASGWADRGEIFWERRCVGSVTSPSSAARRQLCSGVTVL